MTFCDECGTRFTKYDRECPGCGAPTGIARPLDPPKPEPKVEPKTSGGVTDWLDDLEVLPVDLGGTKKEKKKEIPHAHLQTVRDASGARVEVVLDNGIDPSFPPPKDGEDEPPAPPPAPKEEAPKRDSGWFLTPDDGSRPQERRESPRVHERPEPERRPDKSMSSDELRDHYINRRHGLDWQKEDKMRFDASDGYHGLDSIKHEVTTEDGATWTVPSSKEKKKK